MAKKISHTSMRGVALNMEAMRTKNEQSVAVTGRGAQVRMNARGDTLTTGGRVDKKREQIEQEYNLMPQGKAKRIDVRAVEADSFETPQQALARVARQQSIPALPKVEPKRATLDDDFVSPTSDTETSKGATSRTARRLIEKED
jgi:hypothetical protein